MLYLKPAKINYCSNKFKCKKDTKRITLKKLTIIFPSDRLDSTEWKSNYITLVYFIILSHFNNRKQYPKLNS